MAVRTRAQLNADADVNLPDNESGDIDAVHVRDRVKDLADSALLSEDVGTAAGTVAAGNDVRFPVMPHDFTTNVGIGNATKDTEALLAWAAYISVNNVGTARLSGKAGASATFRLAEPLVIGPSGGTIATRLIECNATILAVAPLEDMVHLRSIWGSSVLGRLFVSGTGGSTLSSNTCTHGIRISSAGSARLGYLTAKNFKGWGIRNTGGNVHFASIAGVDVAECGAKGGGGRDFPVTVTGFARTGLAGGGNQRSVLTIDDPANLPPAEVLPTWGFVIVNKFPHKITAVDYTLGTISVFPWLHGDDEVPGVFQLMFGGGLRLGGQSAQTTVDSMVSVRCGTAVWLYGVGTPVLKGFGSNHDGNAIVLGDTHLSVFGGATVMGAYFEATHLGAIIHLPQTASSSNGSLIAGITSLARSQIFSPWARQTDGVQSSVNRYFPVTLMYRNQIWFPWSDVDVRNDASTLQTSITLTNVPRPWPRVLRHTYQPYTITLEDDTEYRRIKGNAPITWIMYGRGAGKGTGGGYKRTLRINAGPGKTINDSGFQVVEVAAQENPVEYRAVLEDDGSGPNIWRVTMTEALPIPGTEATPVFPGNITDLDVVASTSSSLTVEFTEASNADYYEYRQSLNNTPGAWGGAVLLEGSAASGTFTGTVEGLDANEVYDIQVRGHNDNGPGAWSNTATGATLVFPGTVDDLAMRTTTIDSVTLQFTPVANADLGYEVRYSITTLNEWTEDELDVSEAGGLLVGTVPGLEEDETYDFQVRGLNANGPGAWSNLVTATAEAVLPGDIDDLAIVETTYESFTLQFSETTHADSYQVRYSVTTLNDWTETGLSVSGSGTLTGMLSGLAAGVTYDVQVRGMNEEGPGEWSNLVTGTASALLHYQIDTFTASGTWTAPVAVETVDYAEGWGAGGGSSYNAGTTTRMGGGGSAYARTANIEVTPETGYTVTVAAASAVDTDGGDSSFVDGSTLLVKGGKAGINGSTGGQASECVGDVAFDGGTGGTSTTGQTFGGGAAGDQSAASGGVPGERQPAFMLASGATRTVPGSGAATNTSPGGGARGEIRIHYKRPVSSGFPAVVSRNWGRIPFATGNTTTHPINMPPSLAVGNLLLAWVAFRAAPDLTIPGDWTVLAEVANGSNNKGVLLYKFAEGGDSLTITSSTARFSSHLTWQFATAGVPTVSMATGTGAPNAPSHAPAAGSDKYLWLALGLQGAGNSNISNMDAPASYGSFNYLNQQHSTGAVSILAAERFREASSEDPAAFTSSSSNAWVAATVAIPLVEV